MSSLTELDSEDGDVIPKPDGEAGRPGRGGYNLEKILGWQKKDFQLVKVLDVVIYFRIMFIFFQTFVKSLIEKHLDETKSYSNQSLESINVVLNLVSFYF